MAYNERTFLFPTGPELVVTSVDEGMATLSIYTETGRAELSFFLYVAEERERSLHAVANLRDAIENLEARIAAAINAAEVAEAAVKASDVAKPVITFPPGAGDWRQILNDAIIGGAAKAADAERPYSLLDGDECTCPRCQ